MESTVQINQPYTNRSSPLKILILMKIGEYHNFLITSNQDFQCFFFGKWTFTSLIYSLVLVSIVPLLLKNTENEEVWLNSRYSSTRFCRPIQFSFQKETNILTRNIINDLNKEINILQPTKLRMNDMDVSVEHELILSMVNGKVNVSSKGILVKSCTHPNP